MIHVFLWGFLCATSLLAGLFFLKFWRDSGDRLFLVFACAFGTLSVNWVVLAVVRPDQESSSLIYLVRLAAFLLLLAGIVDKNRADRNRRA